MPMPRPSTMRSNRGYTLLFDGDCRICTAFARAVRMVDVRRAFSIRAIQESGDLLRELSFPDQLGAAHVVAPDGRVTSGGAAMPAILAGLVADPRLEDRLRASRTSMSALAGVYRVMAQVRGQLSCAAAPASAGRSPR